MKVEYTGELAGYGHPGDAGIDLYVSEGALILGNGKKLVGTGVSIAIPEGYFGMLVPRSSAGKLDIGLANTIGIIDATYRGEIKMFITNHSPHAIKLKKGQKVCQLIILPFVSAELVQVTSLEETGRGEKGFGSTGA